MKIDLNAVRAEAERQLIKEKFETTVSAQKALLRAHRPWWRIMFPYEVTIRRIK